MPANAKQKAAEDDGARPLNEVKLLLVGQPDAGKTSLVKRLLDGAEPDDHEPPTDGLARRAWDLRIGERDVRVHVWDFGGQEILHATHRFFLTKRSLYLLVVDCRLDDAEARIVHWMNLVESFGTDSRVLVVQNKTDVRRIHVQRDLKKKHPLIEGFHETSCLDGDGIPALRRAIEEQIERLAIVRQAVPLPWLTIKDKLEKKKRPFLKREELDELCQAHGVPGADERRRLVETLRDVGTIVSFHDTWLEDTTVLDPAWITAGVYRIVSHAQRPDRRGIFEAGDLAKVLDPAVYADGDRRFLVEMMVKFELMLPLDAAGAPSRWLLPGLLPEDPVDVGPFEGAVVFVYTYAVLFDAIVSQLLVRMHPRLAAGTCSRRGAVLKKPLPDGGECRARIQADREDGEIEIRVVGPTAAARCDFLAEIRGCLEQIHAHYPTIGATPNVAWSDDEGHHALFRYDDLLTKEQLGRERPELGWDIVPGTSIAVRVRDVLALVRPDPPPETPAPEPASTREREPAGSSWRGPVFLVFAPAALFAVAIAGIRITHEPSTSFLGVAGFLAIVSVASFLLYEKKVTQKTYRAIMGDAVKAFAFWRGKSPAHDHDEEPHPRLDHLHPKRLASHEKAASKSTATTGKS